MGNVDSELAAIFPPLSEWTDEQKAAVVKIRHDALALAKTILENSPVSVDQDEALRKLREAVLLANAAIVDAPK